MEYRKKLRLWGVVLISLLLATGLMAAPVSDVAPTPGNVIEIVIEWLVDWFEVSDPKQGPSDAPADQSPECGAGPECDDEKFPTIDPGG